jgi:hypothetical protein
LLEIKEQQLIRKSSKPLPVKSGRYFSEISSRTRTPEYPLKRYLGQPIVDDIVGLGETVTLQDVSLFIFTIYL